MGAFSRGWQLTKLSFGVIRKDKEILLFPVVSGVVMVGMIISFIIPWFLGSYAGGDPGILFYIFWITFYFLSFIVSTFFTVAMIGCAMKRLEGKNPTFMYGLRFALSRLKYIVSWALFSATVSMILRALQQRSGIVGKIIFGLVGIAWAVATYFALPVIAFENVGPLKAVRRSASILRQSWGEALVSNLGIGLVFFLLAIPGFLILFLGIYLAMYYVSILALVVCVAIAILYWIFMGILSSAVSAVLMTALYRYATTGKTTEEFPSYVLSDPWSM